MIFETKSMSEKSREVTASSIDVGYLPDETIRSCS